MINAGASPGTFATGECGIDIILNYGDYSLPKPNDEFVFNLAYARSADAIVDLSTETNSVKKKINREQIFQFLDAAAYYGFHHHDNGSVMINNAVSMVSKTRGLSIA